MAESSPDFIASLEADIARGARGVRRAATPGAILGIDPGASGALCLLKSDGSVGLADVPMLDVKPRRVVDLHRLAAILAGWAPAQPTAWIELVGPRPTDGSVAAFSFGANFSALKAMCVANHMPLETVAPVRWRRAMGLGPGDGKDASRARASALMPQLAHWWPLVKHDGRAESALIALYGLRQAAAHHSPTLPPADVRALHPAGHDGGHQCP